MHLSFGETQPLVLLNDEVGLAAAGEVVLAEGRAGVKDVNRLQ